MHPAADAVQVSVTADVWTILTAIGTVAAAVVAVGISVWSYYTSRGAAAAAEDKDASAQARRIVVIPRHTMGNYDVVHLPDETVDMLNASDEPILEARIIYGCGDNTAGMQRSWDWVQGNGRNTSYTELIRPGDSFSFTGDWQARGHGAPVDLTEAERGGLYGVVTWSDSRDRHWLRHGREQPIELLQPWTPNTRPIPRYRTDRDRPAIRAAGQVLQQGSTSLDLP